MNIIDNLAQGLRKHSPEILVGAGVIGVVVGTVMACKATKKIDPIIEEHKDTMTDIHMAADTGILPDKQTGEGVAYTEKDKRRDTAMCYGKTALDLTKLYLPSGLVIVGSLVCILTSHKILSKRNVGLAAAYAGVSQAFEEYRKNIVEKFGEDADVEARYAVKAKRSKKDDSVEYEVTEDTKESDHSRFFDAESNLWEKSQNYNLMAIKSTEQNLNMKLKTRRSHIVSLNEVYEALDLRPSEDGQALGYIYDKERDICDANGIPEVIKISVYVLNNRGKRTLKTVDELITDGMEGNETVMLLDFPGLVRIV